LWRGREYAADAQRQIHDENGDAAPELPFR